MDNAAGIFISYRRQEANYLAGWLHDCLTDHFGEARVFLDIDWIRPGVDFMEVIRQGIASSGALLVIIGPHWLTGGPDGDGRRRLDETNDPVRVEIETALRHDLRIIPLLLDDTVMPEPGDLPVGLARLADLNALRVRYETFRADVDRLVRILDEEIGTAPTSEANTGGASVVSGPRRRTRTTVDRAAGWDARQDDGQRDRKSTRLNSSH